MALEALFILVVSTSLAISHMAMASDADILKDYELPINATSVDANYFTFTGGRSLVGASVPAMLNVVLAGVQEFPALNGQGVSLAILEFPPGVANPLHTHPRSTEILLVITGNLKVGFIDTKNNHFNQTLQAGDMFVFPKGLVHYQYNYDPSYRAITVSAFGSANSGIVSLPSNLLTTGIDDAILAQSFKTDVPTIQKLKAGVAKA